MCKPDLKLLIEMAKKDKPELVIIDPLYAACKGDLMHNDPIKEFLHIIRCLAEEVGCAVMIVHHMTKPSRNQEGKVNPRSDRDAYGSAFILAAVDHCFWLERWTKTDDKKDCLLRCDTQRGGDIVTDMRLRLEEPDPLHFYIVGKHEEEEHKILTLLKSSTDGMNFSEILKKSRVGRTTTYRILKDLQNTRIVVKSDTRPVKYSVRKDFQL